MLRWLSVFLTLSLVIGIPSCARDRELVSISIQPATATFLTNDPAGQIQFRAVGTFIHPPETKDISDQVTWGSDVPQLIVQTKGVVSPAAGGCGIVDISASMNKGTGPHDNFVVGFATITINDPTRSICPGGTTTQVPLVVTLSGAGKGTITSVPGGITCPAQACGALFNLNSTVVLTATANSGSTFGGWSGCTSTSGNTCTVNLTAATTVGASFN